MTVPPPNKGKPVLLVLLLVGIAGATGLITWVLVTRDPAPEPAPPPPPPRRPTADLIVEPPPEPLLTKSDAGADADVEDEVDAEPAKKRRSGPRRYRQGTIDKRRVSAFIRSRQGAVRRCYERRLKINNALQGVLDTQITILPNGRVSNVNFTQDTLYDSEVKRCVAGVIRGWQFPEPEGGSVTVSNLFRFSPRLGR
jgi:hypothetical protein